MTNPLKLSTLLPLRQLVVTMQVMQEITSSFFHQPALTAFIRFLLDSPDDYDQLIRIDVPESGRISYAKGSDYRFVVIGLAGSEVLISRLIERLQALPGSARKIDLEIPFRNNWKLKSLQDGFTGRSVASLIQLSAYDSSDLDAETAVWRTKQTLRLRWLTPVRLLKDKRAREEAEKQTGKAPKGDARYCRDAADLSADLIYQRVYDALANLIRARGEVVAPRPPATFGEMAAAHVFWLDASYKKSNGSVVPTGGMAGWLGFDLSASMSRSLWPMLVLGQYTGLGQSVTFGWGRYQLLDADGGVTMPRVSAASHWLEKIKHPDNLVEAWRHVVSGADAPSWSGFIDQEDDEIDAWQASDGSEPLDDTVLAPLDRLTRSCEQLRAGSYPVPALYGHLIPKRSGGVRALAVPPAYDRIVQRAVAQILTPVIEKLMYRHSHGYRKGRSRMTARYDIQAAWRQGYRWVYESDIKAFFDSVAYSLLADRLYALYGDDPIIPAILKWMQAPVKFEGQLIERKNGLPQGAPLSPLMANLVLDDFDSDMRLAGFKLVRFADDFIVLCKNPEQAKQAAAQALRSLEEHGFSLHPDKTRTVAMDEGFHYLGYLFVNDMALDISGTDKKALAPIDAQPNSWLAQMADREPTRLKQKDALVAITKRLGTQQAVKFGERENSGQLLVVTGEAARVVTRNRHIQVFRKDHCLHDVPWRQLQAVILYGNHQITTQAMHAAMQANCPIHLASGTGVYKGVLTHQKPAWGQQLWLEQLLAFRDESKALYLAREVVSARLKHMKENLRLRNKAQHTEQIDVGIREINRTQSLASLRGFEGNATKEYFFRLAELLPDEFGFDGRNRRPPRDPFNVLLSIGYTAVYGFSQSTLHAVGLLPWQGFYHQARGRHACLASDLMEPFRHLAERVAITLILRKQITPEDFSYSPTGACLIDASARRKYITLLLLRWQNAIRAKGAEKPKSYFDHLHAQALSLRGFLHEGSPFDAFQVR